LSKERSYYGFLAADHLDQDYQLSDRPVDVDQELLKNLTKRSDFQAVREFRFFNRQMEAGRQWWFAIRNLNKPQLLAAAKLAQQWHWDQIAIFTIARAEYWDDVELRFPLSYQQLVLKNASMQQLEPAIVFGLVRRESAFDKDAQSPVGASGLMQIMPQTGRQIASKFNEKWHSKQILFNPSVNLKYGTYYYKQLLDRFEGNFVLAAAGYNAGPTRVDRWLPEEEVMPADIWIETISYKETREYVNAILAYAIIYQQRIGDDGLRIKDFMPDVVPEARMNIKGNKAKLHF
jgi:soluble lytic murein transglycosylase